ncbi:putative M18 family aminopeptidase 2 [Actinorhabdospora filicis]|uniref:M18 family aminopeptidase n=1 Tax=Actinorhabdospora filicis TaxID=1785913 RepID=A0A9W6WEQ6_9ACTN|nr:M18 family aminopeptidase [Actinorhabdospora filicis]GLZ82100.1 putative M18 family aminopeptidase 2 [Actinorhabdospora filicis]
MSTVVFDRSLTDDLMAFVSASPSPYHAVRAAAGRLERAGFTAVEETAPWPSLPGGHYLIRGGALIAWFIPEGAEASTPFRITGAHTDSPNLRVKPHPDAGRAGWKQVAVEIYGGVPRNTWLDRDLGLAGRISLLDGTSTLVDIDRPLLRVPQLAVHLHRDVNQGLVLDPQQHMTPIWGLGGPDDEGLIAYVAKEAGVDPDAVAGWDLMTYDLQPPAYIGRDGELMAAPRLDDLLGAHSAVMGMIAASQGAPSHIPVLALFDHEEVGSESDTGAGGPLLGNVLDRLIAVRGGNAEDRLRALAATVCVSIDVGHAVHPNYVEKHEPGHHPMPNGGPMLKVNVNQRYATDGAGRAAFVAACQRAGVPSQVFVSNNAMPCGTTIGPITAARLGIHVIDVGVAILSMHSARELCGSDDPYLLAAALAAFQGE